MDWWERYKCNFEDEIRGLSKNYIVCFENLPNFDRYYIPLTNPYDLLQFALKNDIFVNIDTTHYAQNDFNILYSLDILKDRVKTIHLRDFIHKESHVFVGEGELDLKRFIESLNYSQVKSLTFECTIDRTHEMSNSEAISRLSTPKLYVENIINNKLG